MIDTLTLSRELTKVGIPSAHADAIATGIQQATGHGDHVTASLLRGRHSLKRQLVRKSPSRSVRQPSSVSRRPALPTSASVD